MELTNSQEKGPEVDQVLVASARARALTEGYFYNYDKKKNALMTQVSGQMWKCTKCKKEMKKLKCDEECYKEQVDIVNQIFLRLLSSNNNGVKIQSDFEAYCDLERTFADSCKLTRNLGEESQYSTKTKGRRNNDKFNFYFNEEHNLLFCFQPKVGLSSLVCHLLYIFFYYI